jgi:flotillin
MNAAGFGILALIAFVVLVFFTIAFMASRYKRCPSDKVLVIYGRVEKGRSSKTMHGGGAFVWPLIQDYAYLSLTPITISIPLENALSLQNIRINVPSTFTVGVSTVSEIMSNAAERILRLPQNAIEEMAKEIIFGQLRLTVASLTIEQINQDRESFLESIRRNVEPELNKIGLQLINVNITDITDASNTYPASVKRPPPRRSTRPRSMWPNRPNTAPSAKQTPSASRRSRLPKPWQPPRSAARPPMRTSASASRSRKPLQYRVKTPPMPTLPDTMQSLKSGVPRPAPTPKKERRLPRQISASSFRNRKPRQSRARTHPSQYCGLQRRSGSQTRRCVEAGRSGPLRSAGRHPAGTLQGRAGTPAGEEVVRQEIEKNKVEIAAEAEAERIRRQAKGEADGILAKYQAEAEGPQAARIQSRGYRKLIESVGGDAQAASTLLMIEKLEELVSRQVEAISNLKIDKITVWDSGGNGDGSSTSNFISNLFKSLPPLQEISEMAGFELPEYLGKVRSQNINSLDNGKSTDPAPKNGKPAPQG